MRCKILRIFKKCRGGFGATVNFRKLKEALNLLLQFLKLCKKVISDYANYFPDNKTEIWVTKLVCK